MISGDYVELKDGEISKAVEAYGEAWKHPHLPLMQYVSVLAHELERLKQGIPVEPFETLLGAMRSLRLEAGTSVLDVGAATGYYAEVLRIGKVPVRYHGVDFSEGFVALGRALFAGVSLDCADARCLPFAQSTFDVVLSGACMMHVVDYPRMLAELARVAKRYVILHRTPVVEGKTQVFSKLAYGIRCIEIHFGDRELEERFACAGLATVRVYDGKRNHRTYVLEKMLPEPYASNPNV
jgi:SAM-dependent methyltransferase